MTPHRIVQANQSSSSPTAQDDALPEIAWPHWEWVLDKWGISISVILGIISYFIPFLADEATVPNWIWVGGGTVLLFLGLAIPTILYMVRAFKTVRARYRQYPVACAYGRRTRGELEETQQRVNEILPYVSVFEIKDVILEWSDQETYDVYIVVSKVEEIHLKVGDNLQVIDETDDRQMGIFRVHREREQDYFALKVEIDPMWLGSIREDGRREQYPPMNAIVRLKQRGS